MSIQPATCRLCSERHWSHEPHKYPKDLKPRASVTALVVSDENFKRMVKRSERQIAEGNVKTLPQVKASVSKKRKPRTETAHTCECGAALQKPSRGPVPKFCSNKCRMRANRKKIVNG